MGQLKGSPRNRRAPGPTHFSLSGLVGGVTCLAFSAGILRYTYFEALESGGGLYPTICILGAIVFVLMAVALISPRAGRFALGIVANVIDIFLSV